KHNPQVNWTSNSLKFPSNFCLSTCFKSSSSASISSLLPTKPLLQNSQNILKLKNHTKKVPPKAKSSSNSSPKIPFEPSKKDFINISFITSFTFGKIINQASRDLQIG